MLHIIFMLFGTEIFLFRKGKTKLRLEPTRHDSALAKQSWYFVKLDSLCEAERKINKLNRNHLNRLIVSR
uniref:Uncharacterized protein n=1 Tax=Candidatus Kentrum sp. LFY TaxID=2126342 RepID=A0A450U866_9GAMM|nr:MAG: hypothetical protein BECKLFY1418A_GA0070994_100372 [Candidatus Kentron sp. LFY]